MPVGLFTNLQDVRTFEWKNGMAVEPNQMGTLIFLIVGAWISYICFCYYTFVNYCFFLESIGGLV